MIVAPETRQTLRGERVEGLLADRKGQMGVETRSAARRLNGALDRHALLAQGLASPLVEAKVVRGAIGRPQGVAADKASGDSRRGRVQNDGSVRGKYAGILDPQVRGPLLPLVSRLRCRRGGVPRSQDHGRSVRFSPNARRFRPLLKSSAWVPGLARAWRVAHRSEAEIPVLVPALRSLPRAPTPAEP